ncbi:MAG TPA: helix-turn-helix transcriptional regulator [Actinocrinis sp.]|jgi:transcriptional regulator with XRE-family HTH domain
MTDDTAAFGPRLRAFRVEARLSQQELAERSGLSVRAISDLEGGRTRRPYQHSVERLADALGLSAAVRREFTAAAGRRLGRLARAAAEPGKPARQPDGGANSEQTQSEQTQSEDARSEPADRPAHVVSRQLPAPVAAFVGRQDVLADLARLADRSAQAGGIVVHQRYGRGREDRGGGAMGAPGR